MSTFVPAAKPEPVVYASSFARYLYFGAPAVEEGGAMIHAPFWGVLI